MPLTPSKFDQRVLQPASVMMRSHYPQHRRALFLAIWFQRTQLRRMLATIRQTTPISLAESCRVSRRREGAGVRIWTRAGLARG